MRMNDRVEAPARGSRVWGVGAYRPSRIVGNDEIAARIGVPADRIERRSGIVSRRFAEPAETLAVMGAAAVEKALAMAEVEPRQVGVVLVATTTHLTQMPALAPQVATMIGSSTAAGVDLSAACAGFCYGVALASDMVRCGTAEFVVVLGAERTSDILDHDDPSTAFLFADGAGAVVIGPSDTVGIGPAVWGSDGSRPEAVGMSGYWAPELRTDHKLRWPVITMSGWRVFRWATEELVEPARSAVERAGLTVDELDAFIPHQANMLVTETLARRMKLPDRVAISRDVATSGNTSAASVPLAMEHMLAEHQVGSGNSALLIGFGSGLVYAGQVVTLP